MPAGPPIVWRCQIAKRVGVGVAPLADDPGPRKGKRRIWGGCADAPRFPHRLIAAGKPKQVAIVACMGKLLRERLRGDSFTRERVAATIRHPNA